MGISKKSSNVCTSLSSSRREPPQIDLARALSQVQSAVKPIKKDAQKNLLKNLNVMLKLKRMSLLAEAQRVKAKKEKLTKKRKTVTIILMFIALLIMFLCVALGVEDAGTSSLWTCLCAVKKSEKSSVISHRLVLHLISTIIVVVRTTNTTTTTMLLPLGPSTPVLEPVVNVLLSDLAVLSKLF
ncbi:hypothetical protein IGI04_036927, partial [Brassica rapa subsp. trilocularis]